MLNFANVYILVGLLAVVFAGMPYDAKADDNNNGGLTSK